MPAIRAMHRGVVLARSRLLVVVGAVQIVFSAPRVSLPRLACAPSMGHSTEM